MSRNVSWLGLTNATAIVTGAGSGIGAAIAKSLAYEGCHVVLTDINGDQVHEVAKQCTRMSPLLLSSQQVFRSWTCDVTKESQVKDMIGQADNLAKEIHESKILSSSSNPPPPFASILVNCAGITRDNFFHKLSSQDYEAVMNVNVKGTYNTCQSFCDPSRLDLKEKFEKDLSRAENYSCSIINISSVIGKYGNIGQMPYATSKGAVMSLTRSLAKEMLFLSTSDRKGAYKLPLVRVNTILPGFIQDTAMTDVVPEKLKNKMDEKIGMKCFGNVEDVANLALFLASCKRSGYITGESIDRKSVV